MDVSSGGRSLQILLTSFVFLAASDYIIFCSEFANKHPNTMAICGRVKMWKRPGEYDYSR